MYKKENFYSSFYNEKLIKVNYVENTFDFDLIVDIENDKIYYYNNVPKNKIEFENELFNYFKNRYPEYF